MKNILFFLCAVFLMMTVSCGKKQPDYVKMLESEQKLASDADLNRELSRLKGELDAKTDDTDKAKVYKDISSVYLKKADYRSSISEALNAVKYQPNLSDAHAILGSSYLRLNRLADAERELQAAIDQDAKNSRALYETGNLLLVKGRFKEAAESYTAAIAVRPDYAEAYANRGNCHAKLNDAKKAEADFLKALSIDAAFAPACKNLGILYETKLGSKEKAKQYYTRYLELAPNASDRAFVSQWIKKLG